MTNLFQRSTNLEDYILGTISYSLNVSPTRLYSYTHFRDDLHLDQVDMTLLIATLESRLNVFLSDEEVARIETIGDCHRYFRQHAYAA